MQPPNIPGHGRVLSQPRYENTSAADVELWFAMQSAMVAEFITTYPVNRLLIVKGMKGAM